VARETELVWFDGQQIVMVSAVGFVADGALADCHWPVQKTETFGCLVAILTKVRNCFCGNQKFGVTTVGVMALHAISGLKRFVDVLLCSLLQVAVLTKLVALTDKLPRVLVRIHRFVTRPTVTQTDRRVHVSLLTIICVTFFCDTRFLESSWFFHCTGTGEQ
jgi:hypothetical protein